MCLLKGEILQRQRKLFYRVWWVFSNSVLRVPWGWLKGMKQVTIAQFLAQTLHYGDVESRECKEASQETAKSNSYQVVALYVKALLNSLFS